MFRIAGGILLAAAVWSWGLWIILILALAGLYLSITFPPKLLAACAVLLVFAGLARLFRGGRRP